MDSKLECLQLLGKFYPMKQTWNLQYNLTLNINMIMKNSKIDVDANS